MKMLRDPELRASLRPDRVISFGPLPTSRVLRRWLEDSDTEILYVSTDDRNLDPGHARSIHLQCRAADLTAPGRPPARSKDWIRLWLEADRRVGRSITTGLRRAGFPFEGAIVRSFSAALRKGSSASSPAACRSGMWNFSGDAGEGTGSSAIGAPTGSMALFRPRWVLPMAAMPFS